MPSERDGKISKYVQEIMETYQDIINLLQEKHDIIKKVNVEFSLPNQIKKFDVEYFRPRMPELPGGMILE